MPISVREVAMDDLVALMPIWDEIVAETTTLAVSDLIARIELSLSDIGFKLYTAWDGTAAVGVACVALTDVGTWTETPGVQVSGLHVLGRFRQRGVARLLMNAALACADSWGCTSIVASVPSASRDANRFLVKLGFVQASTNRIVDVATLRRRVSVEPRHLSIARMRRRSAGTTVPEISLRRAVGK